jgi:flagellar hook protein FlgE
MMSAQQAYSAAAQVMSAANKMYDTLISAVR